MEIKPTLHTKYYEGMKERLTTLEVALLKTKIQPITQHVSQDLFSRSINLMNQWHELSSYRHEPLVNKLITKLQKVGRLEIDSMENDDMALESRAKLKVLIEGFDLVLKAVNHLDTALTLENMVNPINFKSYIQPLEKINQLIEEFERFSKLIQENQTDLVVILESYNVWCNAVKETFDYLLEGIKLLESRIITLENKKLNQ